MTPGIKTRFALPFRPISRLRTVYPVEILPGIWVYRFRVEPETHYMFEAPGVESKLGLLAQEPPTFHIEYSYVWAPYIPFKTEPNQ